MSQELKDYLAPNFVHAEASIMAKRKGPKTEDRLDELDELGSHLCGTEKLMLTKCLR
jgi:hypothetical protein